MGEFYMPPESDLESGEHPLRVLSQENLTIVSTFTGIIEIIFFIDLISVIGVHLLIF